MAEKLKVVVVGAGDMGRTHARAYARLEDVAIVGIADPDMGRTNKLAQELSVAGTYADYQEAIEREKPDLVSACVPACTHAEVAVFALEYGANVLSEKPISLTIEGAEKMIATSKRAKGQLGVIFQRRYLRAWQEAKARLPQLGSPLTYLGDDIRSTRPKVLMHSRSGNGGPVIDCCVHDFDMALRLFGPAVRVFATGDTYATGKPEVSVVEDMALDTAHITVDFAAGHKAAISCCWGLPVGCPGWGRNELLGPEGAIRVLGDSIEIQSRGGVEKVEGLKSDGHGTQIAAYVAALKAGEPVPAAPEDALAALRIAHGALESIRTGAPVSL